MTYTRALWSRNYLNHNQFPLIAFIIIPVYLILCISLFTASVPIDIVLITIKISRNKNKRAI